jgi:hypothetical protein
MRFEAKLDRLARRFPGPAPEIIVNWSPMEIFSTRGWRIFYDENGVFTKVGDVPEEYTEDHLRLPAPAGAADEP